VVVLKDAEGKDKGVLSAPWRHVGMVEVLLDSFWTSVVDGGEWPASHPGRFGLWKELLYTLNGRLGGPSESVWTF